MGIGCWDHWKRGLRGTPESWERCSSPYGTQNLQVWGSLTLTPSLLLHIPCPKSLPVCKHALEASQWLCVL